MPSHPQQLDPRASLIENLLAQQDDVIRQLEELDAKLLATIESIHPSKKENAVDEPASVEIRNTRKAA
jgi:hypothetical protein